MNAFEREMERDAQNVAAQVLLFESAAYRRGLSFEQCADLMDGLEINRRSMTCGQFGSILEGLEKSKWSANPEKGWSQKRNKEAALSFFDRRYKRPSYKEIPLVDALHARLSIDMKLAPTPADVFEALESLTAKKGVDKDEMLFRDPNTVALPSKPGCISLLLAFALPVGAVSYLLIS